jgi:hypothetical protein
MQGLPETWILFKGFLQRKKVEKGCARLSYNIQLATEWPRQAGPWPASITEKQRKLPARAELNWTVADGADGADGKNVWSITSTPWWINCIESTSILNRTVFCVTVPCSSKMAQCFGGKCHLHTEVRWFYLALACVLLLALHSLRPWR